VPAPPVEEPVLEEPPVEELPLFEVEPNELVVTGLPVLRVEAAAPPVKPAAEVVANKAAAIDRITNVLIVGK